MEVGEPGFEHAKALEVSGLNCYDHDHSAVGHAITLSWEMPSKKIFLLILL